MSSIDTNNNSPKVSKYALKKLLKESNSIQLKETTIYNYLQNDY
jgi:hypothetical protein